MSRLASFEEFADQQIFIELHGEISWQDVAPILDAIPDEVAVRVEKITVGVGGFAIPGGIDVASVGMGIVIGKMLLNLGDDLYSAAKPKLIELYRTISRSPGAERTKAMNIDLTSDTLDATFWVPTGLSDEDFDAAWTSMREYFDQVRKARSGAVVMQFEPGRGWWVDEIATEFWDKQGNSGPG